MSDSNRRHVFISHHHKDDAHVTKLTKLLSTQGYDIRNSSIRAKPINQQRLDQKKVKTETLQRLLRMKMTWASTAVVLIGDKTHERKWVNWEIQQAHMQGKRIVGVFAQGCKDADIPPKFEAYGSSLVAWNSNNIMKAIDGKDNSFQNPDGTTRSPVNTRKVFEC